MEEELLSVWNTQVLRRFSDPLAASAIVESSLIKEHALLICGTGAELDLPSAIAFVVCAPTLPEQTKQNMLFRIVPPECYSFLNPSD